MTRVIGLSGAAGSGKSTAAKYLIERHGFTLVKFASPLKNMLRAVGLTDYELEGDGKHEPCDLLCGQTPRHAMQTLGTEWGRDCISSELWVSLWASEAAKHGRVVCDDVRFLNEVAMIHKMHGLVIGIHGRGGIDGSHESESGVPCDISIDNSGSEKSLYKALDSWCGFD